VNAASQWATIGWMISCGMVMGTVFDFYRVASHRFRIPRWLLPALDIAFWAAATLGVFSVLLDNNHGEVRMYVFLGLGIGVTGYFGMFSSRIVRVASWLFNLITRSASAFWKMFRFVIVLPFFSIVRLLAKLLDIAFVIVAAILLWTGSLMLIPLRPIGRYLWSRLFPVRRQVRAWAESLRRLGKKLKEVWELFRKKT
jgi:spore cortex biosynthesis protein YabQ